MRRVFPLLGLALAALVGCGGNVVVDGGAAATTGGGAPGATSSVSGHGGSTLLVAAVSTSAGGRPLCEAVGIVDVGLPCSTPGVACNMRVCCDGWVVCEGGVWTATGPKCDRACEECGAGLFCEHGVLCVRDDVHDVLSGFRCVPNPCPSAEPPDCSCGGSVCDGLLCLGAQPGAFVCTDGSR